MRWMTAPAARLDLASALRLCLPRTLSPLKRRNRAQSGDGGLSTTNGEKYTINGNRSPLALQAAWRVAGRIMLRDRVEVFLGVLLGWAIAASLVAAVRLLRPPRVISGEVRAMQKALHAATVMLPHLRRGLSEEPPRPRRSATCAR